MKNTILINKRNHERQVVEDGDHAAVVETLQSLRESEPSLLVVVLDALGNLSLPASLLSNITADALGLLESAESGTLPVLVRPIQYIQQVFSRTCVVEQCKSMRENQTSAHA